MPFSVPVRVQGHEPGRTPWDEMTTVHEASFGGASFRLKRKVEAGQVLQLSLPLPKAFRRYDFNEPSYKTYALVRDAGGEVGERRVGVLFLGRRAPAGYADDPAGRYLLPSDAPPAPRERRRHPRLTMFVNLKIQRSEPGQAPPQEEQTVAENLGRRGARVLTSLPIGKGEVLLVHELGGGFRTRAEVKNIYVGPDKVPRLNLHFLDDTPERLISA